MADNSEVEDLPAAAPAKAKGGGMLPVILVVVLLPVLSFAMTEFFLIPRVKGELQAALGAEDGHDAHAAKPAKKKDSHGGGHGGGHGKGGGEPEGVSHAANGQTVVDFGTLKTNLSQPSSTLIIVKFSVRGSDGHFADEILGNKDALTDATLKILSLLTRVDTQTPGIQNLVRNDLIASFNDILGAPLVENLYFTDFVTQ